MNATVEVDWWSGKNAIIVPVEALRELSPGEYALFVMENGEPKLRMVEVGIMDFSFAEIISGLEAGEEVITGLCKHSEQWTVDSGQWTVNSQDIFDGRKLPNYPTTRLPDYPTTRLLDYKTIRLLDYPTTRLPDYPTIRLSDYPTTRTKDYIMQPIIQTHDSQKVYGMGDIQVAAL
ncbi:MAG: hypothetical protein M5U34_38905, partial [Chloroflexi bacterium]|nr:hypothetical protein [Chloroflexota bacterium]